MWSVGIQASDFVTEVSPGLPSLPAQYKKVAPRLRRAPIIQQKPSDIIYSVFDFPRQDRFIA